MSGPYTRSRQRSEDPVTDPDEALRRTWELLDSEKDWDQIEAELEDVLDALVFAGYVEEWGHSPSGSLWAISDAGHERLAVLGLD
jgi:hypothetical protein